MNANDTSMTMAERAARIQMWMAGKSSRNKSLSDRFCRWLLVRMTTPKPEDDFLRDELIDNDQGFDPDELDRFQRGEMS